VATKIEVQVPVERQKAAQAAGNFELEDLPGRLAEPDAAVRVGKLPKAGQAAEGRPLAERHHQAVAGADDRQLRPLRVAVGDRLPEATCGDRRLHELISYARQIIGVNDEGGLLICLMGHAGQGPCIPLWVPRDEVTLTVQPNDIILRFDDITFDW
jgi:hypothetical protein